MYSKLPEWFFTWSKNLMKWTNLPPKGLNWQWIDLRPGVLYMLQSRSEAGSWRPKWANKPEPRRPKWDHTGLCVLFEKRMLHLWLVALCLHVVMWSSIRPSSHRYHGYSATRAQCVSPVGGSEPWDLLWFCVGSSDDGFLLSWVSSFSTPSVTKVDP